MIYIIDLQTAGAAAAPAGGGKFTLGIPSQVLFLEYGRLLQQ